MKDSTNKTIKDTNSIKSVYLILVMLLCISTGLICGYIYQNSPKHAIVLNEFQKELLIKEKQALKTMDEMNQIIVHSSVDSLTSLIMFLIKLNWFSGPIIITI